MAEYHGIILLICVALFQLGKSTYLKTEVSGEKFLGLPDDCMDSSCVYIPPEKFENVERIPYSSDSDVGQKELLDTLINRKLEETSASDDVRQHSDQRVRDDEIQKMKIMNSILEKLAPWNDNLARLKKRSGNRSASDTMISKRSWENRPKVWGKRGNSIGFPGFGDNQLFGIQKNEHLGENWNKDEERGTRMQKREDLPSFRWNYRPKVWGKRTMQTQDYISR